MPITDIGSYVTTGEEFDSHWTDVDADRVANSQPEFELITAYGLTNFAADLAAVASAITAQLSLENSLTIAINARDTKKAALRDRVIEFRKQVDYRLKGSIYSTSLPDTPQLGASEQKFLRALDDVADLWTRMNADTTTQDFDPPLVFSGGFGLAEFNTAVAAMRTQYKAVVDAENDAKIGRKKRDALLDAFRDRMVQYRLAIELEYGESHIFTQSLPDVYPGNGGGGGGPTFPFHSTLTPEGNLVLWFQMIAGLIGVTNILVREGIEQFTTGVVLNPGQSQQLTWENAPISGEIDEVALRDEFNNVLATGVRDPNLPDPGP